MNRKLTILQWAIIVSLFSLCTPAYLYWSQFGTPSLSHNLEIWAHFSDFFMLWISIVSLIMISALTYYINKLDTSREIERQELENTRNRPILVYGYDSANNRIVKNIGIGPALNVRITIKTVEGNFLKPKIIPPIMAGESERVDLMRYFGADSPIVCLIYQDIFDNFITTETDNELNVKISVGTNVLLEAEPVPFHYPKKRAWNVGI